MAKGKKSVYFCQNCGHEETKWLGQCPACKEWNTFVEEKITTAKTAAVKTRKEAQVLALSEVRTDDQARLETGLDELDRVLGTHSEGGAHVKYAEGVLEYKITGLQVTIQNAPLAPSDPQNAQRFEADAMVTLEVPVRFAGKVFPSLRMCLKVQAGYMEVF